MVEIDLQLDSFSNKHDTTFNDHITHYTHCIYDNPKTRERSFTELRLLITYICKLKNSQLILLIHWIILKQIRLKRS